MITSWFTLLDNMIAPESGNLCEVATGIYWLRMPLPFELDHINLYLIQDGNDYVLIDTGIHTKATKDIWLELLEHYGIRISRVIVTHMHPDHIGNAGWLTEKFHIPLMMSGAEYFSARSIRAGSQGASEWVEHQFLHRCGLSEEYIVRAISNRSGFASAVSPIPTSFHRLEHGQCIQIGEFDWHVMVGRGHSPEHVCLFNEAQNILVSGDHILPQISPNIGVYSTEPDANPLHLYLTTLQTFKALPKDTFVLPSHRMPFVGLHERIDELTSHHLSHIENLLTHCETPRTVVECLPILFSRELTNQAMFFAVAEGIAHLNYLVFDGRIHRYLDDDGVYQYVRKT
ncbi:MBL fold metallo-hydrolase [Alteromonas facilis]|uniref:MBL fold metallo-hydrolase n=1 Tax=Alteromonas facilis TaxID=2048004 RepID=UPI001F0BFF49|nr:MBL fold metallo-hydrolase [Alteromonas facilis]